jgi:hypothetical protein
VLQSAVWSGFNYFAQHERWGRIIPVGDHPVVQIILTSSCRSYRDIFPR